MTHSNEKPKTIEKLGLSTFAFNYDVEQIAIQDDEIEKTEYKYKTLVFDHLPQAGEVINRIVSDAYPDGGESAVQRKGILDKENHEFLAYNEFVESVKNQIKTIFDETI